MGIAEKNNAQFYKHNGLTPTDSNMACTFDRLVTKIPNFPDRDLVGLCHYLSNVDFTPCFQSNDIEFVWSFISTLDLVTLFLQQL